MNLTGDMGKVNGFTPEAIDRARKWAHVYVSRGYQPLPSKATEKRPDLPSYAQWWEGGAPPVDKLWSEHPSGNIQVMCGRRWGLCVLDLDGPPGIEAFEEMCAKQGARIPRTWVVTNDRTAGRHLWFRLPASAVDWEPMPVRKLWGVWEPEAMNGKGAWRKRSAIELLCDRSLVMAPPSTHPKRGTRYAFHRGFSPSDMAYPAYLPTWILALPSITSPRPEPKEEPRFLPRGKFIDVKPVGKLPCTREDVLNAIPDKFGLVEEWGVRIHSRKTNAAGWSRCHDIDRPDDHPSAMFNPTTGSFWRPHMRSVSLFDLAVERGIYSDWLAACTDLAKRFLPHLFRSETNAR